MPCQIGKDCSRPFAVEFEEDDKHDGCSSAHSQSHAGKANVNGGESPQRVPNILSWPVLAGHMVVSLNVSNALAGFLATSAHDHTQQHLKQDDQRHR